MNTNESKSDSLDKIAAVIVIAPIACFFGIVGLAGIIDQGKMSKQHHEELAKSRVVGATAAVNPGQQ